MRVSWRQVHRLYRREANHDEPLQYQQGGVEHREDLLPEEPYPDDMERHGRQD